MKNRQIVALLLASVFLVSTSSSGLAAKCTTEYTCTIFIYKGACEPSKCYADCAAAYKGVGEGQCFPQQGCRCSYCCKTRPAAAAAAANIAAAA
uniref:Knottin scorpion toxin-like domain-containing protein n=1 Tax=Oryza brachyantha TaxID=4533 RepID=J3LHL4_ORYBR